MKEGSLAFVATDHVNTWLTDAPGSWAHGTLRINEPVVFISEDTRMQKVITSSGIFFIYSDQLRTDC